MPIARPELFATVLLLAAAPAAGGPSTNPLAGDTQQARQAAFGPVPIPAGSRGKLEDDPESGGVVYSDEVGWYRFTMANGGSTSLADGLRTFEFESGGQKAFCFAYHTANNAFAKFKVSEIQAELDTLYEPMDETITSNGVDILHRESIELTAPGQENGSPLKVLAWDTRDKGGNLATYTLAPMPAGQLLFTCMAGSASHAREIVQRYLRIGEGMVIPAR